MLIQIIDKLTLSNVRSHSNATFNFAPEVNAIVGPNGSGKTSILEALYILLRGKNFRGTIVDTLKRGTDQSYIECVYSNTEQPRRLVMNSNKSNMIEKRWNIENEKTSRLPLSKKLPVVLFEPEIGRIISGSPERRRDYLDNLITQLNLEYAKEFAKFKRILKQRNSLLKTLEPYSQSKKELDQLFIWNMQLANLSTLIVTERLSVISTIQNTINKQYRSLGGDDDIFLGYDSSVSIDPGSYANKLLQYLESTLTKDILTGYTSFGPHRDEIIIRLNNQPAKERASRGEIRTIVLALKLIEAEMLKNEYILNDIQPVLIFDDVLSELDLAHQSQILQGFKDYQVFVTTTDAHTLTPGTHTIALG